MRSTLSLMASSLRDGSETSRSLVEAALHRADAIDDRLGAYLTRFDDAALAAADAADADLAAGRDRGPLHGIPIGIKDVLCTSEAPTSAQSRVAPPHGLVEGDAEVVTRLRDAGCVVIGKTTTMEHALGFPELDGPTPLPRNPWDLSRWPGGSSSGSAAGVVARLFPVALGSDTCGSIRLPSSFCGATGLRPTYGLVPTHGCSSLSFTMDVVGPLSTSAEDCAAVLSAITGGAPPDHADRPAGDRLDGARIGVVHPADLGDGGDEVANRAFGAAVEELAAGGADLVPVALPHFHEASAAALLTCVAEGAAIHQTSLRQRWSDYWPSTREMLAWGALISGMDYVQAQRTRQVARDALAQVFTEVEAIVMPTATIGAPTFEAIEGAGGPMALSGRAHTFYWNAVTNPVLSLPIGLDPDGMPLGAQMAGRPGADLELLRLADAYQARTAWHERRPDLLLEGSDG